MKVGRKFYMWVVCFLRCSNIQSWKDPDRWITAAQDVQLSVEQKGDFMGLRRACLEKLKEYASSHTPARLAPTFFPLEAASCCSALNHSLTV